MITMTFSQFTDPENFPDEKGLELYVLREKQNILYIGISQRNVWNRWFGNRGRMWKGVGGSWGSGDHVGICIIENMPLSLNWEIDLWTLKECLTYLEWDYFHKDGFTGEFFKRQDGFFPFTIKDVEPELIYTLSPAYNMTYNNGHFEEDNISRYFEFIESFESLDMRETT